MADPILRLLRTRRGRQQLRALKINSKRQGLKLAERVAIVQRCSGRRRREVGSARGKLRNLPVIDADRSTDTVHSAVRVGMGDAVDFRELSGRNFQRDTVARAQEIGMYDTAVQ